MAFENDDNGEDIGGWMADCDFEDPDYDVEYQRLEKKRQLRERALAGKYVIICKSPRDGKRLFYQDRNRSKQRFWTVFKSDAFGFISKTVAIGYCKRLKYNRPKVQYVNPDTLELQDV